MRAALLTLLVGVVALRAPVSAHHSFPAHYFEDQTVSIEGELVEFEYRAPHAWVRVMAPDEKGVLPAVLGRVGEPLAAHPARRDEGHTETGRSGRRHGQSRAQPRRAADPFEEHSAAGRWVGVEGARSALTTQRAGAECSMLREFSNQAGAIHEI